MMKKGQNKISHLFLKGSDLADREKEVLRDVAIKTGFLPKRLMDRSAWWTSKEIGAFRYVGLYQGKKAVLKIQGVKPTTSEIYMIQAFKKANKSDILRPPELYGFLPWDEKQRYEALILEFIEGKKIVNSPTNRTELDEFFDLYKEYKKNCVLSPWVEKPNQSLSDEVVTNFAKWRQISLKLYKNHPLREKGDREIIDKAIAILASEYRGVEAEFQHGHFSVNDLYKLSNNEVVVLSNLYWSWRPPFYDAVFGQHWFIYQLGGVKNVTQKLIDDQRDLWLSKINTLATKSKETKLLNLALLERAAAGLNLDGLNVDYKNPMARYLIDMTRSKIQELMDLLS